MTCIFICHNRIYTDSIHRKDGEDFQSTTKVKRLKKPLPVTWKPIPNVAVNPERNPEEFTDTIHGYAVTGANKPADMFVRRLVLFSAEEKDPFNTLNYLYDSYRMASFGGLINQENHFTIILIGQKADYAFMLDFDDVFLQVHERDNPAVYGSGGEYALKEWMRTTDPIRSMYSAYWLDEHSGGLTDIWRLPTDEYPVLERVGFCNDHSPKELMALLSLPETNPLPVEFIQSPYADELVEAAFNSGKEIAKHAAKQSRHARPKPKPKVVSTPTQPRKRNERTWKASESRLQRP